LAPAYGADPLSAGQKGLYEGVTNNIIRAAEKMPESNYSFKPSPDVRSFGQLVGHLADYQYIFCSGAAGEKPPVTGIEDSKTSKADLVQALKDGYAYLIRSAPFPEEKAWMMAKNILGIPGIELRYLRFKLFGDGNRGRLNS